MDSLVILIDLLERNLNLTSAISAVASAVAAVIAVLVSISAVCISAKSAKQQRVHNELSVIPIPEVTVGDYENSLRVKFRNHGAGPLRVKSLIAVFMGKECKTLVGCMPDLKDRHWTNFSGIVDGRTLLPGDEIVLIELTAEQGEVDFSVSRESARHSLSQVEVFVNYSDIYGSEFERYKKSLSWFGRNLE